MRLSRKFFAGLPVLTVSALMLAFSAFAAESVRIGVMCPLTGSWASEGIDIATRESLSVAVQADLYPNHRDPG